MICLNDSFLKVTPFKKFRGNNGLLKLGESIWYQKHGQASESWKFFHSVTVSTGEMYYWASSVFSVLLWGQKKKRILALCLNEGILLYHTPTSPTITARNEIAHPQGKG